MEYCLNYKSCEKKKKTFETSAFNQKYFQVTSWKGNLCRRITCDEDFVACLSDLVCYFRQQPTRHLLSCQRGEPWLRLRDPLSHFAVTLGFWPAASWASTTSASTSSMLRESLATTKRTLCTSRELQKWAENRLFMDRTQKICLDLFIYFFPEEDSRTSWKFEDYSYSGAFVVYEWGRQGKWK